MLDGYEMRADRLLLERGAVDTTDHRAGMRILDSEAAHSAAISLKRIADMMNDDRAPVNMMAEDIERDPLMIIARALEEMSRPTLPPPADLRKTAEREAKALEDIRDMMRGLVGGRTILRVAQR